MDLDGWKIKKLTVRKRSPLDLPSRLSLACDCGGVREIQDVFADERGSVVTLRCPECGSKLTQVQLEARE